MCPMLKHFTKKKKEMGEEQPKVRKLHMSAPAPNVVDDFSVDIILCVIVSALAVATRMFNVQHPAEIVFDEEHFGKFCNWYFTGEYYLDIHPPLGKLLLAIPMYFTGYKGEYPFTGQGTPYTDDVPFVAARAFAAIASCIFVAMIYITCRMFRASTTASCFAACLAICETGYLSESRLILTDSFLFLFNLLSISMTFCVARQTPFSFAWLLALLGCGITVGCALSVKFTALGTLGTVGFHQLVLLLRDPQQSRGSLLLHLLLRVLLFIVPVFIIVTLFFWIHLYLLPFNGDGNAFMSEEFKATLTTKEMYDSFTYEGPMTMIDRIGHLISTMHNVNMGIDIPHPFQSKWSTWPTCQAKAVLYWQKFHETNGMWLYNTGNPIVYWTAFYGGVLGFLLLSSVALIRFIGQDLLQSNRKQELSVIGKGGVAQPKSATEITWTPSFLSALHSSVAFHFNAGAALWVGYLGNLVPFVLIPRSTWNYHYLPALTIGILLAGLNFDCLLRAARVSSVSLIRLLKLVGFAIMLLAGFTFLFLSPWVYGIPMSHAQNNMRFLLSGWVY